ncbi:hypothetical protein [Celeribacter arenosi]|uniref:Uncharacterized protein n=1 Tax=Celeribacter arenosi TaxID=792649 RepID=A0ABP7JSN7_9RHOB
MGYNATIVHVPRAGVDSALGLLGAERTSRDDHHNESPLSIAEREDSALIWYNARARLWPGVRELDQVLTEMSRSGDVAVFDVNDGDVVSTVRFLSGGVAKWAVAHNAETGAKHLQVDAKVPKFVKDIVADHRRDPSKLPAVEVPVAVFEEMTGFRYDCADGAQFRALERAKPAKRKPWWRIW